MSRIPAGKDIGDFVELTYKPGYWERAGIPERGCRIRVSTLEKIVEAGGSYEIHELVFGLMDWLDVTDEPEPALKTLRQLLDRHFPADGHQTARCCFRDEYRVDKIFHVGPIEHDQPLVAWQRRDWMIAAAKPAPEPGRMVVGAPQPISLNTALHILSLSMVSYMGEPFDSFVGARTSCGRTAAFYHWQAGEVTPIRWDNGVEGDALARLLGSVESEQIGRPKWLPPNQLAMQIAIAAGYLD